jgi:protocatechuate 3,4-dioxygenase alpha subunit
MSRFVPTAEMTLGPFFPPEFTVGANDLAQQADGQALEITGRVLQGDGRTLANVVLEISQADARGRFDNPRFCGWGRAATDAHGCFFFRTIKPGSSNGRAAHINFLLLSSGLMRPLHTVMFFDDTPDPVLDAVHEARQRLIARTEGGERYRFDIRLRGEGETPFFDD